MHGWIDGDLFNTFIIILLARCSAAVFCDAGVDSLLHDATYPQVKAIMDKGKEVLTPRGSVLVQSTVLDTGIQQIKVTGV